MEFSQLNLFGTTVIGIFARATEKFCFLPPLVSDYLCDEIAKTLGVQISPCNVMDSNFVGLFLAGNSKSLVSPEKLRIPQPFGVVEGKYSCLGNLILANDKGALISPLLQNEEKKIASTLGVKTKVGTIAGLSIVGSAAVANNTGVLAHPGITEEETKLINDILGVPVNVGTLNRGSPYVGTCCLANTKGAMVGYTTTPVELARLQEALEG